MAAPARVAPAPARPGAPAAPSGGGATPQGGQLPSQGLPALPAIGAMLSDLLSVPVAIKALVPALAQEGTSVAIYRCSTSNDIANVLLCDMGFVAAVGASLSMIPAGVAAEAVRTGRPSEAIVENWAEVVNIASSLYNNASQLHVRLVERHVKPPKLPPEVIAAVQRCKVRIDAEISVKGYGSGKLAMFATMPA